MYNINLYIYKTKPFSRIKDYGIHPLNEEGFKKYVGPDSHNINYVSRINPKVFKEITGVDLESIVKEQKEKLREASKIECDRDEIKDSRPFSSDDKKIEKKKSDNKDEEKTREENLPTPLSPFTPSRHLLCPKIKTNFSNSFHRIRSFKDMYGYENKEKFDSPKAKVNYDIKKLRDECLSNDNFYLSHSSSFFPKKRYQGFTSYAVPRTDEYTKSGKSRTFKMLNNKLAKSLSCSGRLKLNDVDILDNYEIMKKDNDSMKINIVNQTSQNFLNNYRLPNVTTIANTRKLIKKVDNGNRKLFSEKYNPYALVSPTRNRTGVNYIGALFQH